MWHNFYLSPYHVVMVEMFAKALYPIDLPISIRNKHYNNSTNSFYLLSFQGFIESDFA